MSDLPVELAALTSDDLVTGEAVALDLPAASLGSRMASGLIDVVVTMAALLVAVLLLGPLAGMTDAAVAAALVVLVTVVVFVLYPATMESLTRGRSLGKLALGLRTVRDDAGPISFQHAFVRALVGFVEIYLLSGMPAFFSALLSSRGKRLGDHAAGTYVIRERFPLRLPAPVEMPWQLRDWAGSADVVTLPTGLALAIRQLLGRLHQLTPGARDELSVRLAEQAMRFVAPPPPPGTPPEEFLAAVIATRRERDLARLHREAELRRRLTARAQS